MLLHGKILMCLWKSARTKSVCTFHTLYYTIYGRILLLKWRKSSAHFGFIKYKIQRARMWRTSTSAFSSCANKFCVCVCVCSFCVTRHEGCLLRWAHTRSRYYMQLFKFPCAMMPNADALAHIVFAYSHRWE